MMANFPDLGEAPVGPTRGGRSLDRTFVSFHDNITECGTVPPLETDDSEKKSDHLIAYVEAELKRSAAFKWVSYSYRFYNKESEEQFGKWVVMQDWECVTLAEGSNAKAVAYQAEITDAIERFFPLKTTKRKSTDLPWVNAAIRKRVKQRRAVYKREGRSATWRRLKRVTDGMLAKRKAKYAIIQKDNLLASCLLYTSPSPRDKRQSRMPSSA